jgi:hypothetical protein
MLYLRVRVQIDPSLITTKTTRMYIISSNWLDARSIKGIVSSNYFIRYSWSWRDVSSQLLSVQIICTPSTRRRMLFHHVALPNSRILPLPRR